MQGQGRVFSHVGMVFFSFFFGRSRHVPRRSRFFEGVSPASMIPRGGASVKTGAAVVIARRGGTAASFDVINKYFGICRMPVVASTYWNMVYGKTPEEVAQDEEGMQTMRNLARSMAWLLKCIAAGRAQGVSLPDAERTYRTNFIR